MPGIKSLLLRVFSFLFLLGACTLFFTTIMLFKLPGDVQGLRTLMEEKGGPVLAELIGEEFQITEAQFKDLEHECKYNYGANIDGNSQDIQTICAKINSGEIDNAQELQEYMAGYMIEEQMDTIVNEISSEIHTLHSLFVIVFLGFMVLYLISAGLAWLDTQHLGAFIRGFSLYHLTLAILAVVSMLIYWAVVPSITGGLVSKMLEEGGASHSMEIAVEQFGVLIAEWLQGLIIIPLIIYFIIAGISAFGMFTGFGIPNKQKRAKAG